MSLRALMAVIAIGLAALPLAGCYVAGPGYYHPHRYYWGGPAVVVRP
jgi:hypothetical protein